MLNLIWKDIRELWSSKKKIGLIFLVLIILIISISYTVKKEAGEINAKIQFGVIDEDASSYSELLLEYFKNSESFSSFITIIKGEKQEMKEKFNDGELDVLLTIPKGFAENMISLKHLPVNVWINTEDTTKAILLKNVLMSYEKYIRAVEVNCVSLYDIMGTSGFMEDYTRKKNVEISYNLIFTALNKEGFFEYKELEEYPVAGIVNYYIYDFITLFLLYVGLYTGFMVLKEKTQGTFKRLYTAGVLVPVILLEKILFYAFVNFLLCTFVYSMAGYFLNMEIHIKGIFLVFAVILFTTAFSIMLSGMFCNRQNYTIMGNALFFIFCILGGGIIPIMYLPGALAFLAKFTPNYWIIKTMLSIQEGSGGEYYFLLAFVLCMGAILSLGIGSLLYLKRGGGEYE